MRKPDILGEAGCNRQYLVVELLQALAQKQGMFFVKKADLYMSVAQVQCYEITSEWTPMASTRSSR